MQHENASVFEGNFLQAVYWKVVCKWYQDGEERQWFYKYLIWQDIDKVCDVILSCFK